MKLKLCLAAISLCLFSSCSVFLACFLDFSDYSKVYEFDISKEELKDRIVEAYTYDLSLFVKNLGRTQIENEEVNKLYNKSIEIRLDKRSWDKFKSEIRKNTPDTLNLIIGKHHNWKEIQLQVIITGDSQKSSLTIHGFKYKQRQACNKDEDYYVLKLSKKIEKKLINKLK